MGTDFGEKVKYFPRILQLLTGKRYVKSWSEHIDNAMNPHVRLR